jgi:hypothetical protein
MSPFMIRILRAPFGFVLYFTLQCFLSKLAFRLLSLLPTHFMIHPSDGPLGLSFPPTLLITLQFIVFIYLEDHSSYLFLSLITVLIHSLLALAPSSFILYLLPFEFLHLITCQFHSYHLLGLVITYTFFLNFHVTFILVVYIYHQVLLYYKYFFT